MQEKNEKNKFGIRDIMTIAAMMVICFTIRVINGLIPYFYEGDLSGEVFVDSKLLNEIPSWERGKIVGNVFQYPRSQFFANEVADEIAFGCENYG